MRPAELDVPALGKALAVGQAEAPRNTAKGAETTGHVWGHIFEEVERLLSSGSGVCLNEHPQLPSGQATTGRGGSLLIIGPSS